MSGTSLGDEGIALDSDNDEGKNEVFFFRIKTFFNASFFVVKVGT